VGATTHEGCETYRWFDIVTGAFEICLTEILFDYKLEMPTQLIRQNIYLANVASDSLLWKDSLILTSWKKYLVLLMFHRNKNGKAKILCTLSHS